MNKIIHNKFIKYFVVPTMLLLFWFFMSITAYPNYNLSIVGDLYGHQSLIKSTNGELLKGDKIIGEFMSNYPNLGIVEFRFNNFNRISRDVVLFRIKEVGSKNWYYQNKYKVDQFQPNELFPFGFPIIANSYGHKFIFEIESTQGRHLDAIGMSSYDPVFSAKYKLTKSEIISNIINFTFKKIDGSFVTLQQYTYSFYYLIPFLFYSILVSFLKNKSKLVLSASIVIIQILIYAILLTITDFLIFFEIIVLGVTFLNIFKISTYKILFLSFILLIFTAIFLSLGFSQAADRFAGLVYALFILVIVYEIPFVKKLAKL